MLRFVSRVAVALLTAAVFLLIQSVFWSSAISAWMAIVVVATIVTSYFRPHNGLLILAAFAPLGSVWSSLGTTTRIRGAEALVLAFLAGALLRGWTLHRFRNIQIDRLHVAALSFGGIVALSCLRELWRTGVDREDLWTYVVHQYLVSFRGLGGIFSAMLFVEGLALLLYTSHYCRIREDFSSRLVRMIVISGVGAVVFNLVVFADELLETGAPASNLKEFFLHQRWSAHIGDVNAAASSFAMIMFVALGLSMFGRNHRVAWLGAGIITGLALWMTASRTAFIAVLVVGAFYLARLISRQSLTGAMKVSVIALTIVIVGSLSALYSITEPLGATPSQAVSIRWMFLQTTWRMLQAHPVFGVGVGQYTRWSAEFSPPELAAFYVRENAHNNFAQVAGELGLAGLVAFLAVLVLALRTGGRPQLITRSATAGLAVFILSWLGGHPLLVAEVAYPFWLMLGVVAASSNLRSRDESAGLPTEARNASEGWT